MAYDYDKLYGETPDALGQPTPIFVEFFERFTDEPLRVLDVGCGQGRDAVFIARKGHQVIGVDISSNGIRDLNNRAAQENLPVQGIVADITTFRPDGLFDVIVIDRTLHMLPPAERTSVLHTLLGHVTDTGYLLISDEPSNMKDFTGVISADACSWDTVMSQGGYLFIQRC